MRQKKIKQMSLLSFHSWIFLFFMMNYIIEETKTTAELNIKKHFILIILKVSNVIKQCYNVIHTRKNES